MKHPIIFVGLDVHKDSVDIALADDGRNGEIRFYGTVGGDLTLLDKVIRKFRRSGFKLRSVYEAGPCGYKIYPHLTVEGFNRDVIVPSMTPKKSGDRIKTDRWDALSLAWFYRIGELTPVCVPREDDGAMRNLFGAGRRSTCNPKSQTTLERLRSPAWILVLGTKAWSLAHLRRRSDIRMPHPGQQVTFF